MSTDPRLAFLMRRLRTVQKCSYPNINIRILDVGCADGSFMKIVRQSLCNLDRIDGCDVPSRWSENNSAHKEGTIYMQDLQEGVGEIPLNSYHIITLWEVIEHIEDVYSFLRNLRRLIIPGGTILMSSPNLLSLSRFIKGKRWVGTAEQDHKYLFDILSLEMVLKRAKFSCVSVKSYFLPSKGPAFDRLNTIFSLIPLGGMLFAQAVYNKDSKVENSNPASSK